MSDSVWPVWPALCLKYALYQRGVWDLTAGISRLWKDNLTDLLEKTWEVCILMSVMLWGAFILSGCDAERWWSFKQTGEDASVKWFTVSAVVRLNAETLHNTAELRAALSFNIWLKNYDWCDFQTHSFLYFQRIKLYLDSALTEAGVALFIYSFEQW